jgi:hypothetical protein
MKSGSSLIATLIFTTPERVFHRSMSPTNVSGSWFRSIRSRNAILGWIVVTAVVARSSSPFSSATPTNRPFCVRIFFTRAFVRISAPNDSAARRHAAETAPMPPCW